MEKTKIGAHVTRHDMQQDGTIKSTVLTYKHGPAQPQHGDLTTNVDGLNVTATLHIDPRKVDVTPALEAEIKAWLKKSMDDAMESCAQKGDWKFQQ